MNYIEQINLLHKIRRKDSLGPIAVALHVVLLDICNSNDWENPFSVKNDRIMSDLDVTFKILTAARNQLQQAGLIRFKTKNGSALCIYEILTPTLSTSARTSALKAKVRDEVRDEVRAEVGEKVTDEAYIDNKHKPKQKPKNTGAKQASPPEKKGTVDGEEEKKPTLYTACIGIYHDWFLHRFGIGPDINALAGKSMKALIGYFRTNIGKKAERENTALTEEELERKVAEAWKWVLDNWDKLEPFHQRQTKLNEISSSIQNLIVQIKANNEKGFTGNQGNKSAGRTGHNIGDIENAADNVLRAAAGEVD